MATCELCGKEADKLRSLYELRGDGVPVSKMSCRECRAEWLARHGPKPARAELREWEQPSLFEVARHG